MSRRTERVNDLLREEISELLSRHIKDPNLNSFITVTEVVTAADLCSAKVFVSVMGSREERAQVIKRLAAAAGYFRRELSSRLSLRRIPELIFCEDDSIERGAHLLQLLDQVVAENEGQKKDSAKG